jgi:DNA-binding NtrC family response regulator
MVVCDGPEVRPEHLPTSVRSPSARALPGPVTAVGVWPTLAELERTHVEAALRAAAGHRGNAARMLGISERNLYRKLRDYGLLS